MSTEFKREDRYIVFKVSDLGNSLKGDEIRRLAREYAEHRKQMGKKPLDCVVVESDWPEYEPTWQAIETRVTDAQAQHAPSAPEKLTPDMKFGTQHHYAQGWNDAIDVMLEAASEAKP